MAAGRLLARPFHFVGVYRHIAFSLEPVYHKRNVEGRLRQHNLGKL